MTIRYAWRWALADLRGDLRAHDPSKLMIAPILFLTLLALADRAIYETQKAMNPGMPERLTRL